MRRPLTCMLLAVGCSLSAVARAGDVALPDLEAKPATKTAPAATVPPDELSLDVATDIDLANVVTSAAKAITTVQEVPAIVTVITGDDIQRRGHRLLDQALASVPGWMPTTMWGNAVPMPMVRGVQQAALLLHDGVSMFDPWMNFPAFNRSQPLETLKRIEVVTGPGGVLWGANSFLGIVNLISKDAGDVNGIELSAGYGDGEGNKQDFKAYALFGHTFFDGKLKIFQHASYETYIGPVWQMPKLITPWTWGAAVEPNLERSWIVLLDGKFSLGPVSLYYSVPFGQMSSELSFLTSPDRLGGVTVFDRYGILEYKQRFFSDKLSITAKTYYTQFVRDFRSRIFPDSALFPAFTDAQGHQNPGGFQIDAGALVQRYGGSIDSDVVLPYRIRLLGGVEAFNESISGSHVHITSPVGTGYFGYTCPVSADGMQLAECPRAPTYDADRTVVAGYLDAQWRPLQPLTFEGGVRLQQAFGSRPYGFTPLYSAAAVWNFLPGYHVKLNYASGFRAPVFNNTDSAKGGLNWGGNPHLLNERSQAFQAEINGRVLRNVGMFREVELRVDYSYTLLDDLIEINGSTFTASFHNNGKRNVHSVEALARAYVVGDHFVELTYTYLNAVSSTVGYIRNSPNQWVTLTGSVSIVRRLLDVNANLTVYASFEDPNRYPSAPGGVSGSTTSAPATSVTSDRINPVAVVQLGARLRLFHDRLGVSAQFYNVLNQHYWVPDAISEVRPQEQSVLTPAPGFSFFTSVTYRPF
jgi:outer membrane receptor protein involved in Fe transport